MGRAVPAFDKFGCRSLCGVGMGLHCRAGVRSSSGMSSSESEISLDSHGRADAGGSNGGALTVARAAANKCGGTRTVGPPLLAGSAPSFPPRSRFVAYASAGLLGLILLNLRSQHLIPTFTDLFLCLYHVQIVVCSSPVLSCS